MNRYLFLILLFTFSSCSESEDPTNDDKSPEFGEVFDVDGNKYLTVTIGDQIWMTENLRVKRFSNGDPIIEVKSWEEWDLAYDQKKPAWIYYSWDSANGKEFGILYNYYALVDSRGLNPTGWRVPESVDFFNLVESSGGANIAPKRLMSNSLWNSGRNGDNSTGFNAKPGGTIWQGLFTDLGDSFAFWTNSRSQNGEIMFFGISAFVTEETRLSFYQHPLSRVIDNKAGCYIRCIKN